MPYLFNTPQDQQDMLAAIGVASLEELFAQIPAQLRLNRPLNLPPAMSELELTQHMTELAERNEHAGELVCFLGAGSYDHFIPAVVDAIGSRGEFYTSYTPYQPEVMSENGIKFTCDFIPFLYPPHNPRCSILCPHDVDARFVQSYRGWDVVSWHWDRIYAGIRDHYACAATKGVIQITSNRISLM